MTYVYLLQSVGHPRQRYIGLTADLDARLAAHNAGRSPHTSKYRPWRLCAAIGFEDKRKATALEAYLKTGSGWAFAKRHLW
ncbi:MAG: GIY-YIG nuclease family protein [Armatimonadota bacterium]